MPSPAFRPPADGYVRVHILIADDDPLIGQLLSAAFQREGWRTTVARDAMQSMMYALRTPQPDVVLLDLNMPGGAGMDVLQRLKLSTKTLQIPVLIITGSTDPDLPTKAAALGAADYMTKPVDPEAVIAKVKALTAPG